MAKFNRPESYTVQALETMLYSGNAKDLRALKTEYSRMRDVAQKRLDRLRKSDFSESAAVTSHPAGFKKLKELDQRDLAKATSELFKFLNAKGSTVTGQRAIMNKTIATWQKQGLDVNRKNYKSVISVLEELRRKKLTYGSDKVVMAADRMNALSPDQKNQFLDNIGTIMQHTNELNMIPLEPGTDIDNVIKELGW